MVPSCWFNCLSHEISITDRDINLTMTLTFKIRNIVLFEFAASTNICVTLFMIQSLSQTEIFKNIKFDISIWPWPWPLRLEIMCSLNLRHQLTYVCNFSWSISITDREMSQSVMLNSRVTSSALLGPSRKSQVFFRVVFIKTFFFEILSDIYDSFGYFGHFQIKIHNITRKKSAYRQFL